MSQPGLSVMYQPGPFGQFQHRPPACDPASTRTLWHVSARTLSMYQPGPYDSFAAGLLLCDQPQPGLSGMSQQDPMDNLRMPPDKPRRSRLSSMTRLSGQSESNLLYLLLISASADLLARLSQDLWTASAQASCFRPTSTRTLCLYQPGPYGQLQHRPPAYDQPHPGLYGMSQTGPYGHPQHAPPDKPRRSQPSSMTRPSGPSSQAYDVQPQRGPSGTSQPGPYGQPQHRPPASDQPQPGISGTSQPRGPSDMTQPGFSSHPKSGPQPQPRTQPSGITQPRFHRQLQPRQNSPFQPGTFDSTHHGVSAGQSRYSTQPAQPEPCDESQPGPSIRTWPTLQHDVSKCVYCGNNELEKIDFYLDEEEVKKIPYLCPMHFSKGSLNKKYVKEPQDPKKICLKCSFYFKIYTKKCHFTGCNPGRHHEYCEKCVTSMEEAGRLEHGSPLGRRDNYQVEGT
ncbi:Hypothetical predicted protein [Cloeon dipterum]|uniref:Uncharacterized protein n=1 Tax=Cloeon dipterum TaxID=197152 RepID=A0A8S1D506_9INSE|nr:Hypothetical predicted protein [Cloeon dipterum]